MFLISFKLKSKYLIFFSLYVLLLSNRVFAQNSIFKNYTPVYFDEIVKQIDSNGNMEHIDTLKDQRYIERSFNTYKWHDSPKEIRKADVLPTRFTDSFNFFVSHLRQRDEGTLPYPLFIPIKIKDTIFYKDAVGEEKLKMYSLSPKDTLLEPFLLSIIDTGSFGDNYKNTFIKFENLAISGNIIPCYVFEGFNDVDNDNIQYFRRLYIELYSLVPIKEIISIYKIRGGYDPLIRRYAIRSRKLIKQKEIFPVIIK